MSFQDVPKYEVFFAKRSDFIDGFGPGKIVITPHRDGWNDFGLRTRVDVAVRPHETANLDIPIEFEAFLGFLNGPNKSFDARQIVELVSTLGDGTLLPSGEYQFFTMLPEIGVYRELVSRLHSKDVSRVLRALRDVVEAGIGPRVEPWLKSATNSEVFRRSFLRTTESYFAWKNAGDILEGTEFEEVGRISKELNLSFQLAGRPNKHQFQFKFAKSELGLPKRFAVVIGKNGVGKTQTLSRLVESAIRGTTDLTDENGERPSFNRILAFYPTAIASGVFPAEQRRRSKVWYRRFSLGGPGFGSKRRATADLILDLARSDQRIGSQTRFDIFMNALKSIDVHSELALQTREFPTDFVLLDEINRGAEQERLDRYGAIDPTLEAVRSVGGSCYPLSSGELSFLRFAALASLFIENSSLLLFDEPETHLHPDFISQFAALLDNLLEQTGSAAIIGTHSVYFVREAFEDQVFVLRSGHDRYVEIVKPRLKTFGADVGAISYFVFDEDEPSVLAKEVKREAALSADRWESVNKHYKDELSLELLSEIRAKVEGNSE